MSKARYSIIPARAVFDKTINANDLRVLSALGSYTDNDGWCFPSQATLAERIGVTRQTISSAMRRLSGAGYLAIRARTSKGRGKVGNEYRVVTDLADEKPMSESADIGESRLRETPTLGKKPMSAPADVGENREPMSEFPDIAYKELTTPVERPQLSTGENLFGENPKPLAQPKKSKAKAGRKVVAYHPDFLAVWISWPQYRRARSDKAVAHERWLAGVDVFGAEAIAAAAKHYLAGELKNSGGKYCVGVEVFMNGKLEAAVEAAQIAGADDEKRWNKELMAFV